MGITLHRRGATLLDVMTVTAQLGMMSGLTLITYAEAMTRAKIAVVKNDLRVMTVAFESYYVDNSAYPANLTDFKGLLHPIDYLNGAFPLDPFNPAHTYFMMNLSPDDEIAYETVTAAFPDDPAMRENFFEQAYLLLSAGPDMEYELDQVDGDVEDILASEDLPAWLQELADANGGVIYDPTNGSLSSGDLGRTVEGWLTLWNLQ